MKNSLKANLRSVRRIAYTAVAVLMFAAGLPLVNSGHASAATQLLNRSIKMSDSGISGTSITSGIGSGTAVTYKVKFTTATAAGSLVIDFCTQNPIIGDTCTRPTGMSAPGGITAVTGTIGGTGWTSTMAAGQAILDSDGAHNTSVGAQEFNLTGITNSSTTGTFYARITTYANGTHGTYTGPTVVGTFLDFGGIALSTTNTITITARVQESLTFCVTSADPAIWTTHQCSAAEVGSNLPTVTLGHGTPTAILDDTAVDTGVIWSQLSTNATSGATIFMRNSNGTCGGLSTDGGTSCSIPAHNAGGETAAAALPAGTASFGMFVSNQDAGTRSTNIIPYTADGIGTLTAQAPYNDGTHVLVPPYTLPVTPASLYFGMDNIDTDATGSYVTSPSGSLVAQSTAPIFHLDTTYVFAATSALTTPAGIYTANLNLVATGKF